MQNTLQAKPRYTRHRKVEGTPVVADSTDFVALLASAGRGAISAAGQDSIHGYMSLIGGTNPTITLQPLELVEEEADDGTFTQKFINRGADIGPLADGAAFQLATEGGGRWFFRITAVGAAAPTSASIWLARGK